MNGVAFSRNDRITVLLLKMEMCAFIPNLSLLFFSFVFLFFSLWHSHSPPSYAQVKNCSDRIELVRETKLSHFWICLLGATACQIMSLNVCRTYTFVLSWGNHRQRKLVSPYSASVNDDKVSHSESFAVRFPSFRMRPRHQFRLDWAVSWPQWLSSSE